MKVAVVGGSGYTGGELLRILLGHPRVDSIVVTSRQHQGKPVTVVHPNLDSTLKFTKLDVKKADRCDIVFTCVPHTKALSIVPKLRGAKVVDLSADYRLKDAGLYERNYRVKHSSKRLLSEAVYGLPELHRKEIKKARLVANPGCFSTGVILAAYPLVKEFDGDALLVDAKTGVSGAGASPGEFTHFPLVDEDVLAYKTVGHRHIAEMEQELAVTVRFTPHLVPLSRGILSTVHALTDADPKRVEKAYKRYYKKEPFVRITGGVPSLLAVRGSNRCDIGGIAGDNRRRLVLFSAIDNLVKGASGQAVQNMNLMTGVKETTGLTSIGLRP